MEKYWIWLTQLKGIGPVKQRDLLKKFKNPLNIYRAEKGDLKSCPGIGPKLAARIVENRDLQEAQTILGKTQQYKINLLTFANPLYPARVKEISNIPVLLYYKGSIFPESTGIAIVGARRCSQYGKKVTEEAASYLAEMDIGVISGMAKGIDSYAHTASLNKGGNTISMLGNGLDLCYPPEHKELYEKIITQGALISEFPPGIPPAPHNFPRRNRLISAWSEKVLVVEAGLKSGCLITAHHAIKQKRELLAVPGQIYSPESAGCNKLIQKGAEVYLHQEQLLTDKQKVNKKNTRLKIIKKDQHKLQGREAKIFQILKAQGEISLEELVYFTKIDKMKLVEIISLMEVKGIVKLRGSRCQLAG